MALASAGGLLRGPRALAAEGQLETTAVRLNKNLGICIAPLYFAEELLRTEGFADIRYVEIPTVGNEEAVATGKVDFAPIYGPLLIPKIEAGFRLQPAAPSGLSPFALHMVISVVVEVRRRRTSCGICKMIECSS